MDSVVEIPLTAEMRSPTQSGGNALKEDLRAFIVGPENRLVEPAVRSVLDRRTTGDNPLVFYGPSGTGKSHLARGLAAAWRGGNSRQRVAYVTGADFGHQLAEAMETQAVDDFRKRYGEVSLLVVDDLGPLAKKVAAQQELIFLIDTLLAEHRARLILTAMAPPATIEGLLPGLRSRLAGGLSIPLAPPSRVTRLVLVKRLAEAKRVDLAPPVVRLLADGLHETVPGLLGAIQQLHMPAQVDRRPIDVDMARDYLAERHSARQPTLREIVTATARYFSLKVGDLRGPSRRRAVVGGRDVAIFLARHLTDHSLERIGRHFGGRDHTTVLHSFRKIERQLKTDSTVRHAVDQLRGIWRKNDAK